MDARPPRHLTALLEDRQDSDCTAFEPRHPSVEGVFCGGCAPRDDIRAVLRHARKPTRFDEHRFGNDAAHWLHITTLVAADPHTLLVRLDSGLEPRGNVLVHQTPRGLFATLAGRRTVLLAVPRGQMPTTPPEDQMSQSTNNPMPESAIVHALLNMMGVAGGRSSTTPGAESPGALVDDLVEDLVSAVRERLVAEVADAVVQEVTDRLLEELPWRLADEVRDQFDDWAVETARDFAEEVAREVESNLADTLRAQTVGD